MDNSTRTQIADAEGQVRDHIEDGGGYLNLERCRHYAQRRLRMIGCTAP